MAKTVGFIGSGNMGRAIMGGMIAAGLYTPSQILASARTKETVEKIEKELGIATCPVNWPIGSGKNFKGVYDRNTKKVMLFSDTLKGTKEGEEKDFDINDPALTTEIGQEYWDKLDEEIELLDGASAEFDMDLVSRGELSPVFFGSALTNFGVETFLKHFLSMTTSPLPRNSNLFRKV